MDRYGTAGQGGNTANGFFSSTTLTINAPIRYTLTLTPPTGGSISANPPPDADGKYDLGTVVQPTANPSAGYTFSAWTGAASGTVSPVSVTMNADKTVGATFAPIPIRYTPHAAAA